MLHLLQDAAQAYESGKICWIFWPDPSLDFWDILKLKFGYSGQNYEEYDKTLSGIPLW